MLWTNLRNQVRQTPLPKWKPLIPLFEAVMNSFQAVRDAGHTAETGLIAIDIEREVELLSEADATIYAFRITDNGIGLNDENLDSFNTAFSDYKLTRGGKGLGRFTWLKAFDRVEIDSVFQEPDQSTPLRRTFVFDDDYDPDKVKLPIAVPGRPINTIVRLVGFREPYRGTCPRSVDLLIQKLIEHFLLIFLEAGCPAVEVRDQGLSYSANDVFEKDYKATAAAHEFSLKGYPFTVHGFRLTTPRISKHKLVYAANQRGVISDKLEDYLPNLSARLTDESGNSFVYLAIVQSPYLTQRVNPARTDFDFGPTEDAEVEQASLFADDEVRRAEIRDECIRYIQEDLAEVIRSINEVKEEKIRAYVQTEAPQYKILLKYSDQFVDKISPSASKTDIDTALHRELYQREVKMKAEGSRIIKEAEKLDDYEGYHERLADFMEKYNELGVSALAQYVAHRKILLEFLERAISLDGGDGQYPLEKVVHQLVYPMRFTSEDIPHHEQNLWMIDERLTLRRALQALFRMTLYLLLLKMTLVGRRPSHLFMSTRSHHAVAAADAQHLAGDPAGARGGEERDHGRHVIGQAEAAHRIEPHQLLAVLRDEGGVVRGLDQAERNRIRGGAGAAEFARERLHQRDDAGARGGDDGKAGFADPGGIADHADDAPVPAGLQVRRGGMATMDRAVEAGVDLAAPAFRRCVDETLAHHEARVVDEDIEAAEIADDRTDHRLHGGKIGDVGLIGSCLSALGGDRGDERIGLRARAAVVDRDSRALGRERERDLAAHVARRAGHQRDAAIQA
jgi:hypothetical protein